MATTRATVRNNAYVDSVTLLQVSADVSSLAGVLEAALVMATDLNRQVLRDSGLLAGGVDSAGPNDLVIAVRAVNEAEAASGGERSILPGGLRAERWGRGGTNWATRSL